jgi:hypothetical protein
LDRLKSQLPEIQINKDVLAKVISEQDDRQWLCALVWDMHLSEHKDSDQWGIAVLELALKKKIWNPKLNISMFRKIVQVPK